MAAVPPPGRRRRRVLGVLVAVVLLGAAAVTRDPASGALTGSGDPRRGGAAVTADLGG